MLAGEKAIIDFQFANGDCPIGSDRLKLISIDSSVRSASPRRVACPQIIAMITVLSFFSVSLASTVDRQTVKGPDRVSFRRQRGGARRRACTGSKSVTEKGKSRRQ